MILTGLLLLAVLYGLLSRNNPRYRWWDEDKPKGRRP